MEPRSGPRRQARVIAWPPVVRVALLLVGAVTAACSPSPSSTPASTAASGPSVTPAAASPSPSQGVAQAPLVIGCISVEEAECRFLAGQIVAGLPPERGAPFAVEIRLYPCEQAAACRRTLDVRTGRAVIEFLDGDEPIERSLTGPARTPTIGPLDGSYLGLATPSSPRVNGFGPFPYELGHCGVLHVIDFDGSFWLPIGPVDGDHPTIINAETGTMRLLNPTLAEFRGESGFMVQLARFPGPKHFWGCD